jgi:hypothetical protein
MRVIPCQPWMRWEERLKSQRSADTLDFSMMAPNSTGCCIRLQREEIHAHYARQLLASFRSIRDNGKVAGAVRQGENEPPSLVDHLSERELEVLRLLASTVALRRSIKRVS